MINHLQIENFRSVKSAELSPTSIAYFCGPNAAGKTNFTEALDFISTPLNEGFRMQLPIRVVFTTCAFDVSAAHAAQSALTLRVNYKKAEYLYAWMLGFRFKPEAKPSGPISTSRQRPILSILYLSKDRAT